MAKGFDELLEFVLGEIALCGDSGASTTDFRRFVQEFYAQPDTNAASRKFGGPEASKVVPDEKLIQRIWEWLQDHPELVIKEEGKRGLRLREIEEADARAAEGQGLSGHGSAEAPPGEGPSGGVEGSSSTAEPAASTTTSGTPTKKVHSRVHLQRESPIPAEPATSFRMHATEDRVWKAIAGHGIDFKKLPILQFECLQVICSAGKRGIIQPDLTTITGQDKRSTPKRTDELAEKGYIEKRVVNVKGLRTSLCTHKRYIVPKKKKPKSSESEAAEALAESSKDVFVEGRLNIDNLITYLFELLKNIRIISQMDLRTKLGIPNVKNWQGKALDGALTRLMNIDYISRTKARVKGREGRSLLCVKLLRAPTDDDHRILANSGLNRPPGIESILEEDQEGDDNLRDLDLEAEVGYESDEIDEIDRIPPQWTPDRLITNYIFSCVDAAGPRGINSEALRITCLGRFWKRPLEATMARFTDTWEDTQPWHLKHFSLIRDTAITQERKFIHYIFRSYNNFQKAVDAGEAEWAAVEDPKKVAKAAAAAPEQKLDEWGFPIPNPKAFTNGTGAATLQECRESMNELVMSNHWDNSLIEKLGYRRVKPTNLRQKPGPKPKPGKVYVKPPVQHKPKKKFPYCDPVAIKIPRLFQKAMGKGKAAVVANSIQTEATPEVQGSVAQSASPAGDAMDIDTPSREPSRAPSQLPDLTSTIPGLDARVRSLNRSTNRPNPQYLSSDELKAWRLANGFKVMGRLNAQARKMLEEQGLIPKRMLDVNAGQKAPRKSKTKVKVSPAVAPSAPQGYYGAVQTSGGVGKEEVAMPTTPGPGDAVDGQAGEASSQNVLTGPEQPSGSAAGSTSTPFAPPQVPDTNATLVVSQNTHETSLKRLAPPSDGATFTAINEDPEPPRKKSMQSLSEEVQTEEATFVEPDLADEDLVPPPGPKSASAKTKTPFQKRNRFVYKSWKQIAEESFGRNPLVDATTGPAVNQEGAAPGLQNDISAVVDTIEAEGSTAVPPSTPSVDQGATPGPSNLPPSATPTSATPSKLKMADIINAQVTVILTRFNNRVDPGVYINPFATRRIARGRPRRALIAVFKSTRLGELGLPLDPPPPVPPVKQSSQQKQLREPIQAPSPAAPLERIKPGKQKGWARRKPQVVERGALREDVQGVGLIDTTVLEGSEVGVGSQQVVSPTEGTSATILKRKATPEQMVEGNVSKKLRTSQGPGHGDNHETQPRVPGAVMEVQTTETGTGPVSPPEAASGGTESIAQGDSIFKEPTPPPESLPRVEATVEAHTPPGSPFPSAYADPDVMHIPDAEILEPSEHLGPNPAKKRGVVLGGGSVFHKRTRIILDIITRCGGVFPGNNEIHYIFMAAWEKMTNLKQSTTPDRSTIAKHVKMLCSDGTLRHLKFTFQDREDNPVTKQILTFAHIEPLSAEVKALQKQMMLKYPYNYYPDEVSEFESQIRSRGTHRRVEIETELAVEPMFPKVIARRLDERIQKSKEEREKESKEKRAEYQRRYHASKRAERMRVLQQQEEETARIGTRPAGVKPRLLPLRLPTLDTNVLQYYPGLLPAEVADGAEDPEGLYAWYSSDDDGAVDRHIRALESESPGIDDQDRDRMEESTSPINLVTDGESDTDTHMDEAEIYRAISGTKKRRRKSDDFMVGAFQIPGYSSRRGSQAEDSSMLNLNNPKVTFYPNIGIFSEAGLGMRMTFVDIPDGTPAKPITLVGFDGDFEMLEYPTLTNPYSHLHGPTGTFSTDFSVPGMPSLTSLVKCSEHTYCPTLPHSIEDITCQTLPMWKKAVDRYDALWMTVPEHNEFFSDVYRVASWEMRHSWLVQKSWLPESNERTFINHSMPGKQVVSDPEVLIREEEEREVKRRVKYHTPGTYWVHYKNTTGSDQLVPSKRAAHGIEEGPPAKKRRVRFNLDESSSLSGPPGPGQPQAYATGERPKRICKPGPKPILKNSPAAKPTASAKPKRTRNCKPVDPNAPKPPPKPRMTRQRRALVRCIIDTEATDKLLYTIVVSKVLAGGIDQNVDWKVVGKVFAGHPNFNMDTFQKRWAAIKQRCKALIERLTEQFQTGFIEAYERGQAPKIDLDDPASYDWVELVAWARNMMKQASRNMKLPKERTDLEDGCIIEEVPKHTDFQSHWHDSNMQTYVRHAEVCNYTYSVPIMKSEVPRVGDSSTDPELLRAKSWIRASLANPAPSGSESEKLVIEKLSRLEDSFVDEAISVLRANGALKVLKKNKHRVLGDDFTLSPAFYKDFKKVWDVDNFRDAVLFKQQLDAVFHLPSSPPADSDSSTSTPPPPSLNPSARLPLSITASDGALMVIITLVSNHRAKLVPRLPTSTHDMTAPFPRICVWGWTQGNYRAVAAPREHIFWDLDLVPTSSYIFGNPLADVKGLGNSWDVEIKAPPAGALVSDGRVPLWCDMDARFVYPWWERAVSAVLQLIVLRAPSSIPSLSTALQKILENWEIELIVRWLVDTGVVAMEKEQVMPVEWWWCVFGDTEEGAEEAERRRVRREEEVASKGKKRGPKVARTRGKGKVVGEGVGVDAGVCVGETDGGEHDEALLALAGVWNGSDGEVDADGEVDKGNEGEEM